MSTKNVGFAVGVAVTIFPAASVPTLNAIVSIPFPAGATYVYVHEVPPPDISVAVILLTPLIAIFGVVVIASVNVAVIVTLVLSLYGPSAENAIAPVGAVLSNVTLPVPLVTAVPAFDDKSLKAIL